MQTSNVKAFLNTIQYSTPYRTLNQIKTNSEAVTYLTELINNINPKADLITAAYWTLHDITKLPVCEVCGGSITSLINSTRFKIGYTKWCSGSCANKHPDIILKNKNGVKRTMMKKYGVDNAFQAKQVKDKIKETSLARYGTDNPAQSAVVKDKNKQTCLKKYGVDHYAKTAAYKTKVKTTVLARYGVENVFQIEEFKDKAKRTCLEKYGVEYTGQSDIKKVNTAKTCFTKYNVDSWLATVDCRNALRGAQVDKRFNNYIKSKNVIPKFSTEDLLNDNQLIWHCTRCNTDIEAEIDMNWYHFTKTDYAHCPTCDISLGQSAIEHEVSQWLFSFISDIKTNDRTLIKPLEVDMYLPNNNIAIEYAGLWWHSDRYITNSKHLKKTNNCESKNIHLIHIFENEWLYKQDIVKSRLKNLLGIYDKTVGARCCQIKNVTSKTSKTFLDENHIQGQSVSKVNLGLYFKDELISLMTFSKPRFSRQYDWELVRFCNRLGYHVPGAAGKLLSYFEKTYNPKSLVSYADRRWSYSKKNVYQTLGFTLSHVSAPNYWYWKGAEFSSRVKYQKHKLNKLLSVFDPNKSEVENMYDNGYNRIFDCGNLVYFKMY